MNVVDLVVVTETFDLDLGVVASFAATLSNHPKWYIGHYKPLGQRWFGYALYVETTEDCRAIAALAVDFLRQPVKTS